jgi:Flp pilus assembly protein TadG
MKHSGSSGAVVIEAPQMNIVTRKYRAQIVVIMALASATLIGAIALSTDIGLLYYNWGLLQKAADAAVLAGANYLPSDAAGAVSAANSFASQNGIAPSELNSTTVAADQMSITIQLRRTVPYYFARVVGLSSGLVTARATAGLVGAGAVNSMLPIGIDSRTTYTYGQSISLMTGQYGPGNWGPLSLGGTGASNFASNIQFGYSGEISVGQLIPTETGQKTGPMQAAFNARLAAGADSDPSGTFVNHTITDPRVVTVPMINYASVGGTSQVPVLGFAELWLVGIDSHETISTYFIKQVTGGTPSSSAPIYGAWAAVLIS